MTPLAASRLDVSGTSVHVMRGGSGEPVVFLHGGRPNLPYAAGSHLWGAALDAFAGRCEVVAPDLPGFGGTPPGPGPASFTALVTAAAAILEVAATEPVHLVGHDEGGLIGLCVALDRPRLVRSLTIVSSAAAAPSGDGLENLVLAHPPAPRGGRTSQAWSLERLSFSHHHVTPDLLDACEAAARSRPARTEDDKLFAREVQASKARTFEAYRTTGVPVPVQLIWGAQDPLSTLDHAVTLHRLIGARQPATQCHVVNRVGYFPFREAPDEFARLVFAFLDGLAAEQGRPDGPPPAPV